LFENIYAFSARLTGTCDVEAMVVVKYKNHSSQYENIYGEKISLNMRHTDISSERFFQEMVIESPPTGLGYWFSILAVSVAVFSFFLLPNQLLTFFSLSAFFVLASYYKIVSTVQKGVF
jgi:hypothetical protein